jgi:aspartyl-tRNA(Asn)/glutamyl-tRNA(Gln) amidotransferase subunit A
VSADVVFFAASDLLAAYEQRSLSPVEATQAVLDHIARLDERLAAFVTVTDDVALAQARQAERQYAAGGEPPPLAGVPVSIKDTTATRGIRTTMGSTLFEHWVPDFDAPLVERLIGAGAVLVGKTNLPEFGWKGDSGNAIVGPARNPFAPDRTAGGSSGGAAAAVASGMGALAHGSDGAGSIRAPAALCGVFGLKPSHGLVPYHPAGALELIVSDGPITRTVRDAALMLDVMAGPDDRDRLSQNDSGAVYRGAVDRDVRSLKAAYSPDLGSTPVDPQVGAAVEEAASSLRELGLDVEEVSPGWDDPLELIEMFFATACAGMHVTGYGLTSGRDADELILDLDAGLRRVVERGLLYSAAELAAGQLKRLKFYACVRAVMSGYDVLVTPTLPVTAFAAGENHPVSVAGRPATTYSWLSFCYPFNLTGHPAATVPVGLVDGLPVGMQVVGGWRDDATVLAVAAAFERARPWHQALVSATDALGVRGAPRRPG